LGFVLCGALPHAPPKELFEKSSLGIFKNFEKFFVKFSFAYFSFLKEK